MGERGPNPFEHINVADEQERPVEGAARFGDALRARAEVPAVPEHLKGKGKKGGMEGVFADINAERAKGDPDFRKPGSEPIELKAKKHRPETMSDSWIKRQRQRIDADLAATTKKVDAEAAEQEGDMQKAA